MNIHNLLDTIKNNDISNNYLLFGEENFFIDKISNLLIERIIPESEKIFNEKIFYGKDINVFTLLSTLKSFPITGSRQLIVLKEAQKMTDINHLSNYLINPVSSTIFVVCYKKQIDKRKKWVKLFQKNGVLVESKVLYGENISRWIQYILSEKNIKMDNAAVSLLLNFLGNDMSKITNAINKLVDINSDSSITSSDVQEHIGVHRDYNSFELQEALAHKDSQKTLSIVNYFMSNPNKFPLPPLLGLLFSFFSKLLIVHSLTNSSDKVIADKIKVPQFFLGTYKKASINYSFQDCIKIINLLKTADLKFKGITGTYNVSFLQELVLRILR